MNQDEMFKIIGIIIVSFFIIYITMKIFYSQTSIFEGFKTKGKSKGFKEAQAAAEEAKRKADEAKREAEAARRESIKNESSFEVSNSSDDIDTVESTAAIIKAELIKAQDEIVLGKYKQNYEDIIIDLDELCSYMMLKEIKSGLIGGTPSKLIEFKNTKDALNVVMDFLDKKQ
jgi:hypothetical protein